MPRKKKFSGTHTQHLPKKQTSMDEAAEEQTEDTVPPREIDFSKIDKEDVQKEVNAVVQAMVDTLAELSRCGRFGRIGHFGSALRLPASLLRSTTHSRTLCVRSQPSYRQRRVLRHAERGARRRGCWRGSSQRRFA